jgi:regulator of protease activity HflC (stomatin/prohibitin superfamily)
LATKPIQFDPGTAGRTARRFLLAIVLLVGGAVLSVFTMTRIDAGHVGIRVKLAGSARGVQDIPVVTGWVFFNPLTEQIVEFPISVQNVVWTASAHEGRSVDESLTFSSQEGVNINADIGLSFHIEASRAPHLYLRFRKSDLLDLANGYVRNAVRESFNVAASQMAVQDIYGAQKAKLVRDVTAHLGEQLNKDGFMIDQLTINGALRLPENVATAINRAMEQTQQAIQAENRVRQVKAEAEQAIQQAEGQATAARERAKGEADARLITAKAEAKANLILRISTTGAVLQYRALEKWNGHLPLMNGGGQLPLLTFDAGKIAKASEGDEKLLKEILGDTNDAAVDEKSEKKDDDKDKGDKDKKAIPEDAPKK